MLFLSRFNPLSTAILYIIMTCISISGFAADNTSFHFQNDSLEISRLTGVANKYLKANQLDEASQTIDSILKIAISNDMEIKKGDCYYNYSQIERRRGNIEAFMRDATMAIKIYTQAQAIEEVAKTYTSIAQVFLDQKDFESARDNFQNSLKIRKQLNDSLGLTNNLINLGNLCYMEGKYADASDYLYHALRMANALGNSNLAGIALMNMSHIQIGQKNYEKAIEYLEQSLEYHRADKNRKEEAKVLHNLGIVYYELKMLDEAKKYFLEALDIKEELKSDLPGLLKINNNLGLIAKEEKDYKRALAYFTSTIQLAHQTGDRQTEAIALDNLGSMKLDQNDRSAVTHFIKSLEIAQSLGLKKLILSNYQNLQQYYSSTGDYKTAFDFALKYQVLNDSIYNDESAARIIEMQTRYDTEMKEKENQILRDKQRISWIRTLALTLLAMVLTILAISFFVLFRLKRKSLKQSEEIFAKEVEISALSLKLSEDQNFHLKELLFAEEEIKNLHLKNLEQKKQELISATMLIANKNELMGKVDKLAMQIKSKCSDEVMQDAKEIITLIDRQTDLGNQWDQFKIHFETLHKTFFENLRMRCDSLTPHDLQMCAYLKLNLSAKEISRLTNIAPESVNMHRYRLRKKLNIPAEVTLDEFIHEL